MSKTKGRVTLPSESNFLDETKELLERWGADAIRDSDGTKLDRDIKSLDAKIYTTYFVARGHNEFAREHMDECQQLYLMSKRHTAVGTRLEIDFMDGYFDQQVVPDLDHDPKKWWEVMDRTTGQALPPEEWDLSMEGKLSMKGNLSTSGGQPREGGKLTVVIPHAEPFHEYTVSFLVYAIWDPTQMYNHITNNWGDKPHEIPFDVRQDASGA